MATDPGIQQLLENFIAAWNGGDARAAAETYADDGVLIDPFGTESRGRQALANYFSGLLGGPLKGSHSTFEVHNVRQLGTDFALIDATQKTTGATTPDGTKLPEMTFHVAGVVAKQGSEWRFLDGRPYVFAPPPGQ